MRNEDVQWAAHRTLPQSRLDEPLSLLYILHFDSVGEPHPRMRLTQSNHRFKLSCGGGDALLLCAGVDTCFAHVDVRRNQSVRGVFSELWVDLGSGVGNVGRERLNGLR